MDDRSLGTSLLSVMISMTLGMMVLLSATSGYQWVKKQYTQYQAHQQVLDTVRTAFQFLTRDLEDSGYRGSRSRDPNFKLHTHMRAVETHAVSHAILYPTDRRLVFGCAVREHALCAEGRDVLMIYDVPRKRHMLRVDLKSEKGDIYILGNNDIRKGALVLISDYVQGDLFIANAVIDDCIFHQNSGLENTSNALSKSYRMQDHTEVVELQPIVYYLKKFLSDRETYGLYRENVLIPGSAQELLQGITGFQLKYGIWNAEANIIDYRMAKHIQVAKSDPQWKNVVSVQITLTILNGYTRLEEHFETEIALRNTPLKH